MPRSAPRYVFVGLLLSNTLLCYASPADDQTPSSVNPPTTAHPWHGRDRADSFGLARVLPKLNLTADQQAQVSSIMSQSNPQLKTLRAKERAAREALAGLSPNDPTYQTVLASEKSNAVALIQQASDIRTQIYSVLTPVQQAQVPAIVASNRADREAWAAAWHAQ